MEAFFLSASHGHRLCVLHVPPPGCAVHGCVVYVAPLAEEMNRCRRMVSVQARALAEAGFAVLQMDLLGCGDSVGDFADATWNLWLDDVALARQWLAERYAKPLWLWGVRAGCLLAAASAASTPTLAMNLLLWQPVLSGRQHLQQFLRLRSVAEMVQGHEAAKTQGTDALLQQLKQGHAVEIAGYALSPALVSGLADATLENLGCATQVVCLEVGASLDRGQGATAPAPCPGISPALGQQLQRWSAAGLACRAEAVFGEPFWLLQEAQLCMALVQATVAALATKMSV